MNIPMINGMLILRGAKPKLVLEGVAYVCMTTPNITLVTNNWSAVVNLGKSMATRSSKEDVDTVRVAVRCRPLSDKENEDGHRSIVQVDRTRGEITVSLPNPKGSQDPTRTVTFDIVFGPDSTQMEIYNETARPIVDAVLEGYNGTIFAYGQTGTGKTYTMVGEKSVPEKMGIIPNSFAHVFGHIAKCEAGEIQFLVRVSFLEIYNEKVRDLLSKNTKTKLEVRERPDIGVYVKDLSSFVVKNTNEMAKLMAIGSKNRAEGRTDMNEHSSRSHTIFTTTIEQSQIGPDKQAHVKMGKLHMVDLAGSERISKTGATGTRKDEAGSINRSLINLGIVISALVDSKSKFVPYRNSQLTRLLQDSLGGNSKTVMIANIGPADYNSDETLNTLRYANSAKNIQNKARINEDPKDAMLREFQKEIEKLRKKLEEDEPSDGEEEEEDSDEEAGQGEGQGDGGKKRKKKKKGSKKEKDPLSLSLSPKAMAELKQQIEKERVKLRADKNMVMEERNEAHLELEKKEEELRRAQAEQAELEKRLKDLESKVIVGGINLLEEAETQEKLLERSRKDLEKRRKKEEALREKLRAKEAERLKYEEKIAVLQETKEGVNQMLKDTWKQLQAAKEELTVVQEESEREKEALLDDLRERNKELGLQSLIIDLYIPAEYQQLIENHTLWDEESGEWHLHGVAYAGNNMRREKSPDPPKPYVHWDTLFAYLSYSTDDEVPETLGMFRTPLGGHRERSKVKIPKSSSRSSVGSRGGRASRNKKRNSTTSVSSDQSTVDPAQYPTTRGLVSRQKHFA